MRELLTQTIRIDPLYSILTNERRNFSHRYAAAEVIWYLADTSDCSYLLKYAPSYGQYLEQDGKTAYWAYGPRFMRQLFGVIALLKHRPRTRRAVLCLWRPEDLAHSIAEDVADVPCVTTFQFFQRHGKLSMQVYQRSQDLWVGFPNDVFSFCTLQRIVAEILGCQLGDYMHVMGSCHIYEAHVEKVCEALESHCQVRKVKEVRADKTTLDFYQNQASCIAGYNLNKVVGVSSIFDTLVDATHGAKLWE